MQGTDFPQELLHHSEWGLHKTPPWLSFLSQELSLHPLPIPLGRDGKTGDGEILKDAFQKLHLAQEEGVPSSPYFPTQAWLQASYWERDRAEVMEPILWKLTWGIKTEEQAIIFIHCNQETDWVLRDLTEFSFWFLPLISCGQFPSILSVLFFLYMKARLWNRQITLMEYFESWKLSSRPHGWERDKIGAKKPGLQVPTSTTTAHTLIYLFYR